MGFRFRRSVKLLPGVKINLSNRGASVSLGGRGFHYTIGSKGTRVTAGIPGTGLSWSEYKPHARKATENEDILPSTPGAHLDPPQQYEHLKVLQNATAPQISALSTSELASILNAASQRIQLAPAILAVCLLLFIAALI